jgi:hypothetical protein
MSWCHLQDKQVHMWRGGAIGSAEQLGSKGRQGNYGCCPLVAHTSLISRCVCLYAYVHLDPPTQWHQPQRPCQSVRSLGWRQRVCSEESQRHRFKLNCDAAPAR